MTSHMLRRTIGACTSSVAIKASLPLLVSALHATLDHALQSSPTRILSCVHCAPLLRACTALHCANYRTVRVWSLRRRAQTALKELPACGRVLAYTPDGTALTVGMSNGAVAVLQVSSN
jgi:hypothetical protein